MLFEKKAVSLWYRNINDKVMKAIVIKSSSLVRVNILLKHESMLASAIVRVEKISNSVYFYFDSLRELSHASTVFYVAGISHRCAIR